MISIIGNTDQWLMVSLYWFWILTDEELMLYVNPYVSLFPVSNCFPSTVEPLARTVGDASVNLDYVIEIESILTSLPSISLIVKSI